MPDDAARALDAFLAAHAQQQTVPVHLYAQGEALHQRLSSAPPALPAWGRFLVAMGELASTHLGDDAAASRYFLAALTGAARHGDHEAAVTAGYDQGVLQERRGAVAMALAAYRAAATEGFRLGVLVPNTLRAAAAAVRLGYASTGTLEPRDAALAKSAWLGWTWLRHHTPDRLDAPLMTELGRQLCAFLLPEDDPAQLTTAWRAWPPHALGTGDGDWRDDQPQTLIGLFAIAAHSADQHLRDEGADPGAPYRLLGSALARCAVR